MLCIQQKASALTRRSAGLPAMIAGILSADPKGDLFATGMVDLQVIANAPITSMKTRNEPRLPQVHAINCLKVLFTDTRLGSATEPYVESTLVIATKCLEQDMSLNSPLLPQKLADLSCRWAIRNCGLMLIKALITRLAGGNGSKTNLNPGRGSFSFITFEKFPVLATLLIQLLQQSCELEQAELCEEPHSFHASQAIQSAFPALELVETFGIPEKYLEVTKRLVLRIVGSRFWSLREKAAHTLSFMLTEQNIMEEIQGQWQSFWPSQNELHGRLLCLKFITCRKTCRSIGMIPKLTPATSKF